MKTNEQGSAGMQDLDEFTVTEAAVAQMRATPEPRLREIMDAAVRHLHAFAREVNLTPDEWLAGIGFLTEVGHACTPYRQEFILLSDVLGVSALVNLLHDKTAAEKPTDTSLLGPFYRDGAPELALGDSICRTPPARELLFHGRILDASGRPVPGARIQVWQTDESGLYDLQSAGPDMMDMRGNFTADGSGNYHFRTAPAQDYPVPLDGPVGRLVMRQGRHGHRPAHFHFLIAAPGHRELVTALYLADSPHIGSDTVFGVARSLIVTPTNNDPGAPLPGLPSVRYDFRLSRAAAGESGRVGADPARIVPVQVVPSNAVSAAG